MEALGSFGRAFKVGRLETGRARGRDFAVEDFAVEDIDAEALALVAVSGKLLLVLLVPNIGPVFRCSVEADGRSRVAFAPTGPAVPARLSLDGDGRSVVMRGAGKRDIGRGRPLDLPGVAVFSSMAAFGILLRTQITN